jgi:dTDP-4-dehydrorhamnose reductase
MRLLMTGSRGTVGGAVLDAAPEHGVEVVPWLRELADPNSPTAVGTMLERTAPGAILHLGMGATDWAAAMARYAAAHGVPFVFTSTASVFAPPGPHRIDGPRGATDDYGRYKIACEDAVRQASGDAVIVRLGYQIDLHRPGNNLGAHLRQQGQAGTVRASAGWIPATSMLTDTATALLDLLRDPRPGTHHLDANALQAWTYPQVVAGVARAIGAQWRIEVTNDRVDDQRLLDSLPIAPLSARLPLSR